MSAEFNKTPEAANERIMIYHSPFEYSYLWLPLIGFTIGFFASVLGSGGGFFFLPALILLYDVPTQEAVATSLAATLPICLVGSVGHYRARQIHIRTGLVFALAGIAGALAGAGLSGQISSQQLKTGFGIYSAFLGLQMFISNWRRNLARKRGSDEKVMSEAQKLRRGSYYGFLAGMVTGTFGTSGAAPVLAGLLSMQIPIKIVAGTSLLVITVTTISALGAHFMIGTINLTLVWFLTSGAVLGAVTGPVFLSRIRTERAEGPVRYWYALVMLILGSILMFNN